MCLLTHFLCAEQWLSVWCFLVASRISWGSLEDHSRYGITITRDYIQTACLYKLHVKKLDLLEGKIVGLIRCFHTLLGLRRRNDSFFHSVTVVSGKMESGGHWLSKLGCSLCQYQYAPSKSDRSLDWSETVLFVDHLRPMKGYISLYAFIWEP